MQSLFHENYKPQLSDIAENLNEIFPGRLQGKFREAVLQAVCFTIRDTVDPLMSAYLYYH